MTRWAFLGALGFALAMTASASARDTQESHAGKGHEEHIGLAGGANASPDEARTDLAIWSLVVFLILVAILWKWAWGPIAASLEARETHIHNEIAEAERANVEAKRLLADHEKKLAEVQNEVRAILDEARRDAQSTQQDMLKQAQAEAQATRERATREIEQAKDHALQEIFNTAATVATQAAGQILRRTMNPQDHRDLVQQALKDLPSRN